MDDSLNNNDLPAADRRGEDDHLPYDVLRRFLHGRELGHGYLFEDVDSHVRDCSQCYERLSFLETSSRILQQRSEDRWERWRVVLAENRVRQEREDAAFSEHVARAREARDRLAAAAEEPDAEKRAAMEADIFKQITNGCFLKATELIEKEDIAGLTELSEDIRRESDEQRRKDCSAAFAGACELARESKQDELESSLDLIARKEELVYDLDKPAGENAVNREQLLVALLKIFSLDLVHSSPEQNVVSLDKARGRQIVVRPNEYQHLLRHSFRRRGRLR